MADAFTPGSRAMQDQFDTRRLADRMQEHVIKDRLGENERDFIARMDMFFLATADEQGQPQCSYKGGDRGFVRVLDDRTIAFPNYDGNGMYLSLGNVVQNQQVGLLFVDFERQHRMRLNGIASIDREDPLMAEYPEAQAIVRVQATQVFPNCPRYVHKMQLVERSRFVPREACVTPQPDWKQKDWVRDALPAHDPARATPE
jgi:predicted pyridoxine 5'-phosphate oxidase superfamily flavin-nucleotide-binding protein